MTFIDKDEDYVDHKTCSDKKAVTISGKIMQVLEENDSTSLIKILATDGEPANTSFHNLFLLLFAISKDVSVQFKNWASCLLLIIS